MSLKRIISIASLLLLVCAGNAFAACPSDVYFKQTKIFPLSVPIGFSAYGDVDGDGRKDLIGLTKSYQTTVTPLKIVVYKRSANGFDTAPVVTTMGSNGSDGFELADINGDGKLDLVDHDDDGGDVFITPYLGDGAGGFTQSVTTEITYYFSNQNFGDLNQDGKADMVTSWVGNVYYHLQQANGTFGSRVSLPSGTPTPLADFNNDGKTDLLIWTFSPPQRVLYNQGNAQFTPGPDIPFSPASYTSNIKDLNGDGRLDFITGAYASGSDSAVAVYYGQPDGGFTLTEKILGVGYAVEYWPVTNGDVDGDGDSDFFVFLNESHVVGTNNGAGQFTTNNYPSLNEGGSLEETSGDGKVDLVSLNRNEIFNRLHDVVRIRENTCTKVGQTKFVDFTGDRQTDIGYFRASDGRWIHRNIYGGPNISIFGFGTTGDIPVAQDYDGDLITDRAIFRPSDGYWYVMGSAGGVAPVLWGISGDKPVPSDFDGDGKADRAIYRPSNGTWWILNSADGSYAVYNFGISEDIPVPMDYDGDGRADVAVFRPSTGYWYIQKSTGGYYILPWGLSTDIPMPGDYDSDGHADIAVFRHSEGRWWVLRLRDGVWNYFWTNSGLSGSEFVPVPVMRPYWGLNMAVFRPSNVTLYEHTQSPVTMNGINGDKIVSTILPSN